MATPETEPAWLLLARSVTSAELAARVRAARGKDAPPDEPGPDLQRVSIRVSPEEAVFIESIGLPMLRAVVGKDGPKHELMSALAAEILAERGHEPIEADPPRPGSCKSGRSRRLRRTLRSQAKAAAQARRTLHRLTARAGGEPEIAWPVMAGTGVESRLAHAQQLVRWRRALEAQRAVLLDLVHERAWHRLRGHATFGDWLDRRLGLAPREVSLLERVVHDVAALPEIEAAWRSGEMSALQWNLITACRPCHALEHLGHIFVKCVDVAQSRDGIAPLLEVRVGDEALRSSTHVYREGLRRRRLEHWQRGPSLVGMVVSW